MSKHGSARDHGIKQAMDSITRDGCELIMNEVYEGNMDGFIREGILLLEYAKDR